MIEALVFALSAYAGLDNWPWWLSLIFGAAAGYWTTRVRGAFWANASAHARLPRAGAGLVVAAMVFGALLCLMVYLAARSLAQA